MRPKNLFKQGKNMPNIDSEETRPAMYNQGRPMNSGVLENNPNIVQQDNKVAFSTQQRNDKFSNIASSGMPDQTADGMGQVNPANTPNKPMGGLDQTFSQSQMAMYGMPMYDAPAKALVGDQASLPDHLKDAKKMRQLVTIMLVKVSMQMILELISLTTKQLKEIMLLILNT